MKIMIIIEIIDEILKAGLVETKNK